MNIYNTFGIQATADNYLEIRDLASLKELLSRPLPSPYFIIGGGSNVVFTRHFPGTVIHMANKGIEILPSENAGRVFVRVAAGEVWDDFVRFCIANQCYGAENLVAIPGCVGSSPVQNVGAYGVEAKDIVHSVHAVEVATGRERVFANHECQFGYRSSIFKTQLKDQYIIHSVTFELSRTYSPNIQYKALSDALDLAGLQHPTALQLADTIASVRWAKLPRPEEKGSAGSFFKNPVVAPDHYQKLLGQYPDLVAFPVEGGYKLAAGWLIQRAGWKGRALGRCGVYERQALVLVNLGGCTGQEVVDLAEAVTRDVNRLFGVILEKEAIII